MSRASSLPAAIAAAAIASALPAAAQTQSQSQAPAQAQGQGQAQQQRQGGTLRVGTLRCDVSGAELGFIFGSTREVNCLFSGLNRSAPNRYVGEISRYGVDLGFTSSAVMLWGVLAPTTDLEPGVLAGTYRGVSGNVTAGVGVGANVLVGGSNRSIQLQPLSVEGNTGLNIALGVAELTLRHAGGGSNAATGSR